MANTKRKRPARTVVSDTVRVAPKHRIKEISVWEDSVPKVHAGIMHTLRLPKDRILNSVLITYALGEGPSSTEPEIPDLIIQAIRDEVAKEPRKWNGMTGMEAVEAIIRLIKGE